MNIDTLKKMDLTERRVLIREDFNVPFREGKIENDVRIRAALPGIKKALDGGARILLMSHLGRPKEGRFDSAFSLAVVAERLGTLLGTPVELVRNYLRVPPLPEPGTAVLLENVRFNRGEKADDESLAKRYASLCDLFVMDAFGSAHRAQASTHGVARFAPKVCAGPLFANEIKVLGRVLKDPARPFAAIVGGSKVSGKLEVLNSLVESCDVLIVGGGIANTFLVAAGEPVGCSLYEPELVPEAMKIIEMAHARGVNLPLPVDVVVSWELSESAEADVKSVVAVEGEDMILDIGPDTASLYKDALKGAGTIVWNGPVGVFEFDQFCEGTRAVAEAVAASGAFSLVGGGDSIAALDKFGMRDRVSYVSTGGGAFLDFIEGKKLPALAVLEQRAARG